MWYNLGRYKLMEAQEVTQSEHDYEPTVEQAQRAASLRRFNILFVYAPIALVSVISLALIIFMLIVAVRPPSVEALIFISGLADAALIIATVPALVVGAAVLGIIAFGYSQARQSGAAPIRQTQRLLWRMDNIVGRLRARTDKTADDIAQPFISVNGLVTYIKVLITQLAKLIRRS